MAAISAAIFLFLVPLAVLSFKSTGISCFVGDHKEVGLDDHFDYCSTLYYLDGGNHGEFDGATMHDEYVEGRQAEEAVGKLSGGHCIIRSPGRIFIKCFCFENQCNQPINYHQFVKNALQLKM